MLSRYRETAWCRFHFAPSGQAELLNQTALEQLGLSVGDTVTVALSDGRSKTYHVTDKIAFLRAERHIRHAEDGCYKQHRENNAENGHPAALSMYPLILGDKGKIAFHCRAPPTVSFAGASEDAFSILTEMELQSGTYPARPDEALLNQTALEQLGLSVGDTVTVAL